MIANQSTISVMAEIKWALKNNKLYKFKHGKRKYVILGPVLTDIDKILEVCTIITGIDPTRKDRLEETVRSRRLASFFLINCTGLTQCKVQEIVGIERVLMIYHAKKIQSFLICRDKEATNDLIRACNLLGLIYVVYQK